MMSHPILETILNHRFLLLSIVPVVVVLVLLVAANFVREKPFELSTFMVGSDMLLGTVAALVVQIITSFYMLKIGNLNSIDMRRLPYHLYGSAASLISVLPLLAICITLERRAADGRTHRRFATLLADIVAGSLPLISAGYIAAVRTMSS